MKVRYTPRAFSVLDVIRSYIAQFNPTAAGKFIALVEQVVKRLSDFPESGQRADEPDTRIAFSQRYPYRIYFRIVSGEILILHIRHASRRPLRSGEI